LQGARDRTTRILRERVSFHLVSTWQPRSTTARHGSQRARRRPTAPNGSAPSSTAIPRATSSGSASTVARRTAPRITSHASSPKGNREAAPRRSRRWTGARSSPSPACATSAPCSKISPTHSESQSRR
jgi:hypothetical protein